MLNWYVAITLRLLWKCVFFLLQFFSIDLIIVFLCKVAKFNVEFIEKIDLIKVLSLSLFLVVFFFQIDEQIFIISIKYFQCKRWIVNNVVEIGSFSSEEQKYAWIFQKEFYGNIHIFHYMTIIEMELNASRNNILKSNWNTQT